jgi:hypothetical protein
MVVWLIIVAVITLGILSAWRLRVRTRKIAGERKGEGFSDFEAYFAGTHIPREILVQTYDYFAGWNRDAVENFPVRATDNIADIYGIVDDDLTDAVDEILKKSGRRWQTEAEQPDPPYIETVGDVVFYVVSAPMAWQ